MPPSHEFGELLSKHLQKRDRSASWLARRLNVSPSTITNWQNGNTRPRSPEIVNRVADILGIHDHAQRTQLLASAGYALLIQENFNEPENNVPESAALVGNGETSQAVSPVGEEPISPLHPPAIQKPLTVTGQRANKKAFLPYAILQHPIGNGILLLLCMGILFAFTYTTLTPWPFGQRIYRNGTILASILCGAIYVRRYGLTLAPSFKGILTTHAFALSAWLLLVMLLSGRFMLGSNRLQNGLFYSRNENGDQYGYAVAAGDFDADGYDDIAVGSPGEAPLFNLFARSGWVYTRRGTNSWPAEGASFGQRPVGDNEPGDMFGFSLVVGDFNGDDYDDLVIGAPGEVPRSLWGEPSGSVYLQKGSKDGLISWRALGQIPLNQTKAGDKFGWSLAAGDFNGDGRDDIAVGAPGKKLAGAVVASGSVYIYRGGDETPTAHQSVSAKPLDDNDGNDMFGYALATGDFNGDGRFDLAVGAPEDVITDEPDQPQSGRVYLYKGMEDGLHPWQTLNQQELETNENTDRFGHALAVGDFNGDGYDDLVVGTPGESIDAGLHILSTGAVFLFHGSAAGLIPLQFLEQRPLSPNEDGDMFGWSLVAGDLNGDETDDLLVGAPGEQLDNPPQEFRSGVLFVFHSEEGKLRAQTQINQGSLGRDEPDDQFGWALAVGDFDDDGATDLVVGAPGETMRLDNQSGYAFTYRTELGRLAEWHGIHQESR